MLGVRLRERFWMWFEVAIHLWWLPKHGINGWTGEPKDEYYKLRGWKQ